MLAHSAAQFKENVNIRTLLSFRERSYLNNIHRIINYGCGTGRHDLELTKLGYSCTGIDLSETMIEVAKKNSNNRENKIDFSVGDIRTYEPQKSMMQLFLCFM